MHKKKRGRPSAAGLKEQVSIAASQRVEDQTVKKKRGRPSLSKTGVQFESQVEEQQPKKTGRPSLTKSDGPAASKPAEVAALPKARKRGRPSKTPQELEEDQQPVSKSQPRPQKHDGPSETSSGAGKKRTRRSDASDTAAGTQNTSTSIETGQEAQRSRRHRSSDATHSKTKRKETDTIASGKAVSSKDQEQRTRQNVSQKSTQNEEDTSQTEKAKGPSYQHLAEVTRRVSRQTIEAKWEPLPAACLERVSGLLGDIQRPVVVRLRDEHRRTQASTVLQMVSRRLVNKMAKGLPFPHSAGPRREDDFDFEKILDRARDLEAQLTLALHANDLLESELQKESAHLEAEEGTLLQLESNAKVETSRRKEAGRKLHTLLQSGDADMMEQSLKDEAGIIMDADDIPLRLVSFALVL